MEIKRSIDDLRSCLTGKRYTGKIVGLVPTMGYFHEGHLSLMRRAKEECDVVVVSIFVNPTQFGRDEDLDKYPRDIERDAGMAETERVDYIFHPSVDEMYPVGYATYVDIQGTVGEGLDAATRPGHFRGVATICTKLFDIVRPDKAYFGQKDLQQSAVIQRLVRDLDIPVSIVVCSIIREPDGLAMSSRNVYLDKEERLAATVIYRSLKAGEGIIASQEKDASVVKSEILRILKKEPLADVEYLNICDTIDLDEVESIEGPVAIALAVRIGKTRLIDNIIVIGD